MLLGILALVVQAGTADLGVARRRPRRRAAPDAPRSLVAALLVVGLGVKVPLWPVHTWLPPAHTIAPTAGSVLLAAVLLKMGTYGIVRLAIATVPDGFATRGAVPRRDGAIGILWGGLACLVERDLKRLVAYCSVAHMGFVALGLASGTQTGMQAALFANVAHGLVSALLFFVVGGLKERWGSADLTVARAALREVSPRLGFALVVGFAAALGPARPGRVLGRVPRRCMPRGHPAEGLPLAVSGSARSPARSALSSPRRTRCASPRLVWAGERTRARSSADSRRRRVGRRGRPWSLRRRSRWGSLPQLAARRHRRRGAGPAREAAP